MKLVIFVSTLILNISAQADEPRPRNEIGLAISCELELRNSSGIEVKIPILRGRTLAEAMTRTSRDFELDSASKSADFFGGFLNRESLDYLFALVPTGRLLRGGGKNEEIGDAYVLSINPVFRPRDLWRMSDGVHSELAEDAISAGRLRGQTRGWVNINVYDDGRIEGYTLVGHLKTTRVKIENGELEFTMPMELLDPNRVSRPRRWFGRVLAATKLGAGVNTGHVRFNVKLKISGKSQAPLHIEHATVVPLDVIGTQSEPSERKE